jgi:uncharacterized protein (DUF433 family)
MGQQPAERYIPLSETELDDWEARARGGGLLPGDPALRLIAEVRRLRHRSGTPRITRTPGRCGGAPLLAGTRIGVADLVALARRYDWDLERLRTREFPQLSAAEIEAAIRYYRRHQETIEEILRDDQSALERLPPAPLR